MEMPGKVLERIRELGEVGQFTAEDVALLEDVANGGNPGGERWIDFACNYLPEPMALPEERIRPGILADSGDIENARRLMETDPINKAVWEKLEGICEEIMRPGSDDYIEFETRSQNHIWGRRQGHWLLSNAVEHLGWAYQLSGEQSYGEYAKGILLTIARTRHGWGPMACNYGTPYKGWLTDNSLDLGHATLPFAVAYDLIHDLLSDEDKVCIADHYEPFFHRICGIRYECVRQMPANSPIIGHCGVGLMALSLADAFPEERRGVLVEAVRSARAYAMAGLDGAIKPDGACVEGSGYSSASMHYLAVFSEGLRRVCGVNLFEHPTWKRNPIYLCCEMLPGGGAINNFNDNHYDGVTTGYWMMAARSTGDQAGPWVWEHFSGPGGSGELFRGGGTVELPYVVVYRDPEAGESNPEDLGISKVHHFDSIQHLVMRTGWEPEDLHVTYQCTPYEADVHAHTQADRLNFTMYGLGERLVIDSGYGIVPIEGSSQVKRMGKLGESHNQVLIDGKAQNTTPVQDGVDGHSKEIRWGQQNDWVWSVGEATAFYEGARVVRRAVLTRLNKVDPMVLIADVVVTEGGDHSFDWLLQTETGNKYEIGENRTKLTGCRTGAEVQVIQVSNLPVSWDQDEWISHPRLIGSSKGSNLISLTLIGRVDELVGVEEDRVISLRYRDESKGVLASLKWGEGSRDVPFVEFELGAANVAFTI
jgi:hypothetical protein